jgi:CHRD domain
VARDGTTEGRSIMTTPNTPGTWTSGRMHRQSARLVLVALLASLAMAACGLGEDPGTTLTASLDGATADIEIDADFSEVCWDVQGLAEWTQGDMRMQIRSGVEGEVGPVVVEFLSGNIACTDMVSSFALREISKSPGRFYVDVHSTHDPNEAVRGQLEEVSR